MSGVLQKLLDNKVDDDAEKQIREFREKLPKEFLYAVDRFLWSRKTESGFVRLDQHEFLEMLNTVSPNAGVLLSYFDFKIMILREFDEEKLSFIHQRHRRINDLYHEILKANYLVEHYYTLVMTSLEKENSKFRISTDRKFLII